MRMNKRAHYSIPDANQKAIVSELRYIFGKDSVRVCNTKDGSGDIELGIFDLFNLKFEIKNPDSGHGLTKKQSKFAATWQGQIKTIYDAADALTEARKYAKLIGFCAKFDIKIAVFGYVVSEAGQVSKIVN